MKDHETIKEMYNHSLLIQNKFSDLDEHLTNNKVVGKFLRVMLRRPQWKSLVSVLEVMQDTNDIFTPDELYIHLRCFKEKLKQAGDYRIKPKQVASPTQNNVKYFDLLTSHDNFIQILDHEVSKDVMFISKMFHDMLTFERKFNKERKKHDKKVIYFGYNKK
jgi:hypothetical protein